MSKQRDHERKRRQEERKEQHNGRRHEIYHQMASQGKLGNRDLKKYEQMWTRLRRFAPDIHLPPKYDSIRKTYATRADYNRARDLLSQFESSN